MDFLDPKIERRNRTVLLLGYCLVALAIAIATLLLLYQAYGFSVDRQGKVTQSGLLFISSQPSGAEIYLNANRYKSNTNTRAQVLSGTYTLQIKKADYRTWQRQVVVNGGDVQHFDYPFLFPTQLKTSSLGDLTGEPGLATQSLDKRWLLLGEADKSGSFLQYDLKSPTKPVQSEITLADGIFTASDGNQTWSMVEWASDNRHVLLLHTYTSGATTNQEYILLDRDTPVNSINLTNTLKLDQADTLSLYNSKVDQVYVFNQGAATLRRLNVGDTTVVNKLDHVLAYKPYGSNMVLYITDQSPTGKNVAGQVSAVLQDGQKTVTLRNLPAGASSYPLNIAQYSGDWYIAVGADNDTAAYVYKNPQNAATSAVDVFPAPWRRLPVIDPSYLAFSNNAQFILAENAQEFVTYDLKNIVQYHYRAKEPIDQPQTHASWMDGDRLLYVSGGKLLVFDYDYRNRQSLEVADPSYQPFFANNYSYVYSLKPPAGDAKAALTSTSLLVTK